MNRLLHLLALLFTTFCTMPAHSQTYTLKEGIALAQKLGEAKILSPKGVHVLVERMKHTGMQREDPYADYTLEDRPLFRGPFAEGAFEEISNTSLLFFLQ